MRSKKCEAATSASNPGSANLPIGDATEAENANREIGAPRIREPTPELKFKLGHYPLNSSCRFKWSLWVAASSSDIQMPENEGS